MSKILSFVRRRYTFSSHSNLNQQHSVQLGISDGSWKSFALHQCQKRQLVDLIQISFSMFTVISTASTTSHNSVSYRAMCSMGKNLDQLKLASRRACDDVSKFSIFSDNLSTPHFDILRQSKTFSTGYKLKLYNNFLLLQYHSSARIMAHAHEARLSKINLLENPTFFFDEQKFDLGLLQRVSIYRFRNTEEGQPKLLRIPPYHCQQPKNVFRNGNFARALTAYTTTSNGPSTR